MPAARWVVALVSVGAWVTPAWTDGVTVLDDDSAALSLPVSDVAPGVGMQPFALTAEGALSAVSQRAGGELAAERISLDFRYDAPLLPQLRAVFADLLDVQGARGFHDSRQINTFKEGYLGWRARSNLLFDVGRINVRQGVALGYNPTDFFRDGALRSVDSLDPNSLRQNRLGTGMVRGEWLWDSGALTVLVAPKLQEQPSSRAFDADFGATNDRSRWSLALTQRLATDLAPQWLVYGDDRTSPQLGVNLTRVVGRSTVAFVEASGGRQASLWAQAQRLSADSSLRAHAATGVSYSNSRKMSFTLEYEYSGTAMGARQWAAARYAGGAAYGRYRALASSRQEPATRHGAFFYTSWQDAWIQHLDIVAFVRVDVVDHSTLPWAEARYHWSRVDAAVRWQAFRGGALSDYGAAAASQAWAALIDFYL